MKRTKTFQWMLWRGGANREMSRETKRTDRASGEMAEVVFILISPFEINRRDATRGSSFKC